MKVDKITAKEKIKLFDKMMREIKSVRPETEDRLNDICRVCGFMLYEFLVDNNKITFEK